MKTWNQPIWMIGSVLSLDALYDDAAKAGCSRSIDKVFLELSDKLVALCCTGLTEVYVEYGAVSDWVHCGQIGFPGRRLVTSHG